jgi:hypothetical protein
MRIVYPRIYISRLRLSVCISFLALLFAPFTLPVAQTNRATKPPKASAAYSQNAELKSLYEAHQWFELRDAIHATRASAFYLGVVASPDLKSMMLALE